MYSIFGSSTFGASVEVVVVILGSFGVVSFDISITICWYVSSSNLLTLSLITAIRVFFLIFSIASSNFWLNLFCYSLVSFAKSSNISSLFFSLFKVMIDSSISFSKDASILALIDCCKVLA